LTGAQVQASIFAVIAAFNLDVLDIDLESAAVQAAGLLQSAIQRLASTGKVV
jgi:chitinase